MILALTWHGFDHMIQEASRICGTDLPGESCGADDHKLASQVSAFYHCQSSSVGKITVQRDTDGSLICCLSDEVVWIAKSRDELLVDICKDAGTGGVISWHEAAAIGRVIRRVCK